MSMIRLLLCLVFLTVALHQSTGEQDVFEYLVDSEIAAPRIEGTLFLLKSKERDRFVSQCMQPIKICSKEEIGGFVFQTKHVQNVAEDWFWSSYLCFRKNDPLLCPVDGGWSQWGPWVNCSATCGRGVVTRHRSCTHPTPANAGRPCRGADTQVSDCNTHIPCHMERDDATANDTDHLMKDMLTFLAPFHREDPQLRRTCFLGHCSHQQVLGMIQPIQLANQYWNRLNCYKYLEGCPVDGGWSAWSEWSPCTSECGTGQSFRSRHCSKPHPSNGGRECPGDPVQERDCFQDTCADTIGTFLTDWTPWSSCTEGCGQGTIVSTRRCHGSDTCQVGLGDEAREVRTLTRRAPCMDHLCPEIGGWGLWGEWSLCSTICGSGYHIRVRACDNPLPVGPGNECSGDGFEKAACSHSEESCTEVLANREYGMWTTWSKCSASCGSGVKLRHRACADHQTLECTGPVYNIWPCSLNQPCPVAGGWSEWSAWTPCSLTCGVGRSTRYRMCSNPWPRHGGAQCDGDSTESKKCRTVRCPALTPRWGSWEEWNECSKSCEGGIKSRQRWCLVRKPSINRFVRVRVNRNCAGEFQQLSVCNTQTCPVEGGWTSWSAWSDCTATCGEGAMSRDRSCTDPAPIGNGSACGGYGTETRHCLMRPCASRGSIKLVFDGSSFIIYRRSALPARHLLIFLVFRPADPHGLLVLRRDEESADVVMMVRLVDSRVHLYAEIGPDLQIDFIGEQVKLYKWNSLEVGITELEAWIRLNDGDVTLYHIDAPIPDHLDWDLPMYVGGALPNLFPEHFEKIGGLTGEIAEIRVNYREYSLHETEEWDGGGLPYVNFNVEEKETIEIDSEVLTFTGEEYTILPCIRTSNTSNTNVITPLMISLTVRPVDGEGVVLYVIGDFPGAFFMLGFQDSNLVLTMSLGHDQDVVQRTGSSIEIGKWSSIDVTIEGFRAEVRVDKGPATQLTSIGHAPFACAPELYVGGVSLRDRLQVATNAAEFRGFVGEILEVTIDWMDYRMYEAALTTDVLVNSASATVAAHFHDIHAHVGASVLLRCQYSHVVDGIEDAHRRVRAQWLYNGDRLLELTPHTRIIPGDPSHPHSASLLLFNVPKGAEGFYACQVTYHGVSVVTHAFSVTVDGEPGDGFAVDRMMDIIIVASVVSFASVCGIVVLMSCCTPCRRRSYFLDLLYDSLAQCCGCQPVGALPPGLTYHDLATVDATYHQHFSPRAEKAKLDAKFARREYQDATQYRRTIENYGLDDNDDVSENMNEDDSTEEMRRRRKTRKREEEEDEDEEEGSTSSEDDEDEEKEESNQGGQDDEKRRHGKRSKGGSQRSKTRHKEDQSERRREADARQVRSKTERLHSSHNTAAVIPKKNVPGHTRRSIDKGDSVKRPAGRALSLSSSSDRPDLTKARQQLLQSSGEHISLKHSQLKQDRNVGEAWFANPPPDLDDNTLRASGTTVSSTHQDSQPPPRPTTSLHHPPPRPPPPPPPLAQPPQVQTNLAPLNPQVLPSDLPRPYHSLASDTVHHVASPSKSNPRSRRSSLVGVPLDLDAPSTSSLPRFSATYVIAEEPSMPQHVPPLVEKRPLAPLSRLAEKHGMESQSDLSPNNWFPEDSEPISPSAPPPPPAPQLQHLQALPQPPTAAPPPPPPPPPPPQSPLRRASFVPVSPLLQLVASTPSPPPPLPPLSTHSTPPPQSLPIPSAAPTAAPPPPPPPPIRTPTPPPSSAASPLQVFNIMDDVFGSTNKTYFSPLASNTDAISKAKLELNRRRRLSTGARFGSGPHHLPNVNQNSSGRDSLQPSIKDDVSPTYTADGEDDSDAISIDGTPSTAMSSGDFKPSPGSPNGATGLVAELMDSLLSKDTGKLDITIFEGIGSGECIIVDNEEDFLCEDCQKDHQACSATNLQRLDIVESTDEYFESCGDISP